MDIQAEKLLLIEQLLRVRDLKVIEQLREVLKKDNNQEIGYEVSVTQYDFAKYASEAEEEYKAGKYIDIDELEKESENW